MKNSKLHILVTGSHRSGSTWVGRIISKSPKVVYVDEPFNVKHKIKKNFPFTVWFEHVSSNTPIEYQEQSLKYIKSHGEFTITSFFSELQHLKSKNYIRFFLNGISGKRRKKRLLYKDPIAILSAEWFYRNINSQIIVLIRHPAAFVASIKVKKWNHDFNSFLKQPELMEDHLMEFKSQIESYAKSPPDIIDQGILLWNIFHSMILKYQDKYPEWYFVKHEEISKNPVEGYEEIFRFLELPYSEKIKQAILNSTESKKQGLLSRDSRANIKTWKKRLSVDEINRIKNGTFEISQKYYTEADW